MGVVSVDPVSILVAALVAGCSAGLSGTVSTAIQEAYQSLLDALRHRLRRQKTAPALESIDSVLADPRGKHEELQRILATAVIGPEEQVVTLARRLLRLADPEGSASGKYLVHVHASQGVLVGDDNEQVNYFR